MDSHGAWIAPPTAGSAQASRSASRSARPSRPRNTQAEQTRRAVFRDGFGKRLGERRRAGAADRSRRRAARRPRRSIPCRPIASGRCGCSASPACPACRSSLCRWAPSRARRSVFRSLGPARQRPGADRAWPAASSEAWARLTMDTLTRMRAFIDVVEAEGFSAAARKIGRSKALLSKYVRELEDELGALLLNRTTRQFSLTEAGHTYYRRASEIVREIDSLRSGARIFGRRPRPHQDLGAAHLRRRADRPVADRFRQGAHATSCSKSTSTTASSTWSRKASTWRSASRGWRARR